MRASRGAVAKLANCFVIHPSRPSHELFALVRPMDDYLFSKGDLRAALAHQSERVREAVESVPEEHLRQADVDERAAALVAEFRADAPELNVMRSSHGCHRRAVSPRAGGGAGRSPLCAKISLRAHAARWPCWPSPVHLVDPAYHPLSPTEST